jgi:hypothetical protein
MAKAGYEVIGSGMTIEPRLNEAGTGIEDVHVVPYKITSGPAAGVKRTVKVPHSMYSTAAVKSAIETDVDTTHDVASLKNT